MELGIIKWFNTKGFGIIGIAPETDVFFHVCKNRDLNEYEPGTPVVFNGKFDRVRNRQEATMMRRLCEKADWGLIMKNLGIDDRVNVSFGHDSAILSVKETAFRDILGKSKESTISGMATDYFENGLSDDLFIQYCDFLYYNINSRYPNEVSQEILSSIWSYVFSNLNTKYLFQIWERRKFIYINKDDCEDYEIPETILKANWEILGLDHINRIYKYSYGPGFSIPWIIERINNKLFKYDEFVNLFKFVEKLSDPDKGRISAAAEELFVGVWEERVKIDLESIPAIGSERDLVKYRTRFISYLPEAASDLMKRNIETKLNAILFAKGSNRFLCELYLSGKVKNVEFHILRSWFANLKWDHKRFAFLSKLTVDEQIQLILDFRAQHGLKRSFKLIYDFHKTRNSQNYISLSYSHHYHYHQYEIAADLLILKWREVILPKLQKTDRIELFREGFLEFLEQKELFENISSFDKNDFERIAEFYKNDLTFLTTLLVEKLNQADANTYEWLVTIASRYMEKDSFSKFNSHLIEKTAPDDYLSLWLRKKVVIRPVNFEKAKVIDHFRIDYLYHMTHRSNLSNIFKYGLLSHEEAHNGKLIRDISDNQVNDRRKRNDPLYSRSLHSYVPFYFNPKNPMLFRRKSEQNEIVILAVNTDVLNRGEVLFSNGNAASTSTKFYNSLLDLNYLDWDCIYSEYWSDHEEGKRTRCSEVLIHGRVPCTDISAVFSNTSRVADLVKSQIPPNLNINVGVNESLYFNKNNYNFNYY